MPIPLPNAAAVEAIKHDGDVYDEMVRAFGPYTLTLEREEVLRAKLCRLIIGMLTSRQTDRDLRKASAFVFQDPVRRNVRITDADKNWVRDLARKFLNELNDPSDRGVRKLGNLFMHYIRELLNRF